MRSAPHIYICNDRFESKVMMDRCRASVSEPGRGIFIHQCLRAGKHKGKVEGKTYLFCAQHHPDHLAKKKKDWESKFRKGEAARDLRYAIKNLESQIVEQVLRALKDARKALPVIYVDKTLPPHIEKNAKKLEKLRAKREETK